MSFRTQMRYMNPYDIHKAIINEYVLKRPGDATKLLQRDTSTDRTVYDVLKQNHKFIWDNSTPDTWEEQFAKKYYDKLFKEYCIGDLSRYKDNKIALRWRTENEVVIGKGQFICGSKYCSQENDLKSWEVNFVYSEGGIKKNALIKIRLCPQCSKKLNHFSKKREVKRLKKQQSIKQSKSYTYEGSAEESTGYNNSESIAEFTQKSETATSAEFSSPEGTSDISVEKNPWDNLKRVDTKTRDDEMEEYLQDLLL